MKQKSVLILILLLVGFSLSARKKIDLSQNGQMPSHNEHYAPADMPEVYFDTDLLEIIIYADGYADYYDVDIISLSTMMAVISTQVDGYGDSIDISLIPDDNYRIVITSSNNNVYEGQFTNY